MEPARLADRHRILRAISRARIPILAMALTYFFSILAGIIMVHAGNRFALSRADSLVARAHASDPALLALQRGERWKAALYDFGRNVLIGAVPTTLTGCIIVGPYPVAAYRGWIGGIVSVDREHKSRLKDSKEAFYFFLTLLLQILPYSLTGGAGVLLGLAYFRRRPYYQGPKWVGIPREAVWDVLRIYLIATPIFLVASLWEFLAR